MLWHWKELFGVSKVKTADELAFLVADGATVAVCGMGLAGWNEEMALAIEKRFLETGHPRNITFFQNGGMGDWTINRGPTHFGHVGLVKRWIGAHIGSNPTMSKLVAENKIEGYNLPQGVICQLWREIAAKRPGLITKVGLGTFVDPRVEGAKLNSLTQEDIVKLIEFEGEEYLFFKSLPIDMALIRGTVADEKGNLTATKEGQLNGALHLAQATRNSGGIVIAQAEYLAQAGSLHPKEVRVPGILVDYVVIAAKAEHHWQTEGLYYNPAFSGSIKVPLSEVPPLSLNERKIIARRAAMELEPHSVINFGVGMPTDVANIATEENANEGLSLTTEAGAIGGVPDGIPNFGHAYNAEAIIEEPSQFDFYDGGGIDIAFLGLAQADRQGNVNVAKFNRKLTGCGGFVDISQNSKKVVFCGSFTGGGLQVRVENGQLLVEQEGKFRKFLQRVEHICFSGEYAQKRAQQALYVTERAVFTLEQGELTLIEIAPGIDLENDILAQMEFRPRVPPRLKLMPAGIFQPVWGRLNELIKAKQAK